MTNASPRTICWIPTWNAAHRGIGLEHLILKDGSANSVVLAFDENGRAFRLNYRLQWNAQWQLRNASFSVETELATTTLVLEATGKGRWRQTGGRIIQELDGCIDIDVWPTPFTNSFPIWREPMEVGERREFRVAWVNAPALTIEPKAQAYTRLAERLYLFESLDGSGFSVELAVDEQGLVLDYPRLFQRIDSPHDSSDQTVTADEHFARRARVRS